MSWEYVEYTHPQPSFFQKMILWTDKDCKIYFALKLNADDGWSYLSGNSGNDLDTGLLLTSYTAEADAQTYYLSTSRDTNGKILAVLPTLTQAKYVRIYIESGSNVSIYEFRPSTSLSAHDITAGELHITDLLAEAPLIRITKNNIDRVKIGNFTGTSFGVAGYDSTSTKIFELSNIRKQIAGWDFTATHLSKNDMYISSSGKIRSGSGGIEVGNGRVTIRAIQGVHVENGGDIFLESNAASGNKAMLSFDTQFKVGAGTNSLGFWGNDATRLGFFIGVEPYSYSGTGYTIYNGPLKNFSRVHLQARRINYFKVADSNIMVPGYEPYSVIEQKSKYSAASQLAITTLETSGPGSDDYFVRYKQNSRSTYSEHIFQNGTAFQTRTNLRIKSASVIIGEKWTDIGHTILRGGAPGVQAGPEITFEVSADHGSLLNDYRISVYQNDLHVGMNNAASFLILKGERYLKIGKVNTPPTVAKPDSTLLWTQDVSAAPGKCSLHMMAETGNDVLIVAGVEQKFTTGDSANVQEGKIVINTYDNNVKIYADGGWRTMSTW